MADTLKLITQQPLSRLIVACPDTLPLRRKCEEVWKFSFRFSLNLRPIANIRERTQSTEFRLFTNI